MNELNPYQTPKMDTGSPGVPMLRLRYRRRTLAAFLVAAVLVYVGLFYHQRKLRTVTFIRNERFLVARMFYFSERQTANSIQWRAFRPLFVWTADEPEAVHAALTSEAGLAKLKRGTYCYLNDLGDLRLVAGK